MSDVNGYPRCGGCGVEMDPGGVGLRAHYRPFPYRVVLTDGTVLDRCTGCRKALEITLGHRERHLGRNVTEIREGLRIAHVKKL